MEDKFSLCLWNVIGDIQADTPCPCVPEGLHLTDFLWIFGSKIVSLRQVVFQIKQLPSAIGKSCQSPVALADGLAVLVLPIQGALVVPFILLLKQRYKAASLVAKRFDAIAAIEGWVRCFCQFQTCGHNIQEGTRLVHDGSLLFLGHTCGPMNDGGCSRSAMELCCLPVAVRCIDCSCPPGMQVIIRKLSSGGGRVVYYHLPVPGTVVAVEFSDIIVLAGCTIVRGKDYDGIIIDTPAFQFVYDTSYVLVHTVYHGGMYLHVGRLEGFVRLVLPFASGCIGGNGHLVRVDKPHLQHLLVSAFTHGVVFGNILRFGLNGPVRFLEGHIHKERLAVSSHFVHHIYSLICHKVRIVEILRDTIGKDSFLVMHHREGVKVVRNTPDSTPVLVKASVTWIGINWGKWPVVEITLV